MKLSAFESVVTALRDARVRYLVAGGIAVNAHGYVRLTYDVDLVIQLKPDNIRPAFEALEELAELAQQLAEMPRKQVALTGK